MDSRVSTANSTVSGYQDEDTLRRERISKEMDQKYNITKRKQNEVLKLKKINTVAQILLDGRMSTMEATFAKQERQHTKETRDVERELKLLSSSDTFLPPLPHCVQETVTPTPSVSELTRSLSDIQCKECRFGTSKLRCKNFPCCLPKTYTSLGFQIQPRTYSILPNYREMLKYSRGVRPPSAKNFSKNTNGVENIVHKTPRISIKDRERGLKQLIKEMRTRNEKNKPKDWAINYGEPLPRRMVLRPIIPSGMVL